MKFRIGWHARQESYLIAEGFRRATAWPRLLAVRHRCACLAISGACSISSRRILGRSVARVLPYEFRFPRQDFAVGRDQRCLVLQRGRYNETISGIAMKLF